MSNHKQPHEQSNDAGDQVHKQSAGLTLAKCLYAFDDAAHYQQPSEYKDGTERSRRDENERDSSKTNHQNSQRQQPPPSLTNRFEFQQKRSCSHYGPPLCVLVRSLIVGARLEQFIRRTNGISEKALRGGLVAGQREPYVVGIRR